MRMKMGPILKEWFYWAIILSIQMLRFSLAIFLFDSLLFEYFLFIVTLTQK